MLDHRTAPYGAFLLRISLGVLFLAHAGLKLFVFTPAGTVQFFGSLGLPPGLAYFTIALELAAGAALTLGIW
ncbi:MAG: putative oxidoreductase, partial [Gammaproteobacteria bacterium]|nr:putative oxidoreductase [Gammaproteobacteria bacterium]